MAAEILPAAKASILEIWDYTERKWGEEQADDYVRGMVEAINKLQSQPHLWRPVRDDALRGIYFFRYRHHYIFFKKLSRATLGVVSILHENMDFPSRLKEDAGLSEEK
jgi:plasmid stabilization system protein ParE